MADLRFRPAARRDLAEILEYSLEQFGAGIAEAYLASFENAFETLRAFPGAGAIQGGINKPIHCYIHRSHRIFYDRAGSVIWVIRILHKARDARRWLA